MAGVSAAARWRAGRWLVRMRRQRLLLVFSGIALLLGVLDPRPASNWLRWLDLPTLCGLLALLPVIEGIRASGAVQRAAAAWVTRVRSQRSLALLLVFGAALLATLLTNDVSLFLIVPLTVALGRGCELPVRRIVILEALGVNAGSTLSPVGNPQNLMLWHASGLSMAGFARAMLPAAGVMLALLALAVIRLVPGLPLRAADTAAAAPAAPAPRRLLGSVSALLLALVLVVLQLGHPLPAALAVLLVYLLAWRDVLRRLDWALLATLAAMFVGLGHFADWQPLRAALQLVDWQQPAWLYLGGVLLSQVLSNVPAAVLLHAQAPQATALAVAVDVGGFGLALGSLANLIALRLEGGRGHLGEFHRISVPFLLVCAPAVWLVQRWLAGG